MKAMELIPLGRTLINDGLVEGAGGNLSYRDGERVVITASGACLDQLAPTDFATLSLSGKPLSADGPRRSSEWALHIAAYRTREECRVVIHAHPLKAIALGLLGRPLPAITPDQYLYLGWRVPVVPYITPTTTKLAAAVAAELKAAPAALLQNHGVVVTGCTIEQAYRRLCVLETSCAIYLDALAVGSPHVLSEREMRNLDEATGGRYKIQTWNSR